MKHLSTRLINKTVLLLLILLIVTTVASFAAEAQSVYRYGLFQPGSTVYLFGDKVNMRVKPATSAPIVRLLAIGSKLTIVGEPEGSYKANGFSCGWYKVQFMDQQKPLEGYVWGGLLALGAVQFAEGNKELFMLAGITRFADNYPAGEIRVVENGSVVAKAVFKWISTDMGEGESYSYSIAAEELPWAGVSDLKNLFQISCNYEACGYARGKLLFFWDGKDIVNGPDAVSVSEAGLFSVQSEYVFPGQDGCKPDELILRTTTVEEPDEEGATPGTAKKVEILHVWNGKSWDAKAPIETQLEFKSNYSSEGDY
ncbi:MAG: hypothetical protein CVV42_16615 [Candidatus Riflebacteria bacterium HGW-Riflebacteria-2]|jgi:hypothetical protein|nr:MAG: hypothetical protein CVV42_16615 [Candidatus Riflebacteria bacterium HGW-Riflebacteria-2]